MNEETIAEIRTALFEGAAIPYLGPAVLALAGAGCALPAGHEALVAKLTVNSAVPFKLRKNLTGAAQFMENFKHRKTVVAAMTAAFRPEMAPTALHRYLAALPELRLLVHAWYDDLPQKALAARRDWGMVQGVSQAEHFGNWVHYFRADGTKTIPAADAIADAPPEVNDWRPMLYQPLGSISPAANYLVSDSDFVEVLTEIDIQTPIPKKVHELRTGRHFLFLGCRFNTQMERMFARQIMKRSSRSHWAVLPDALTKNEARFLVEQNIKRLDLPLAEFTSALAGATGDAIDGHHSPAGERADAAASMVHA